MKRLLVPSDFSTKAMTAAPDLAEIARPTRAAIYHLYADISFTGEMFQGEEI